MLTTQVKTWREKTSHFDTIRPSPDSDRDLEEQIETGNLDRENGRQIFLRQAYSTVYRSRWNFPAGQIANVVVVGALMDVHFPQLRCPAVCVENIVVVSEDPADDLSVYQRDCSCHPVVCAQALIRMT